MPGKDEHLRIAGRFEAFLKQVDTPQQTYTEWIVVLWFHISLHYVDAVLSAKHGWHAVEGHTGRTPKMTNCSDTRPIRDDYQELYKEAKQARYEGTGFTQADLAQIRPLFVRVRSAMRAALNLPPYAE